MVDTKNNVFPSARHGFSAALVVTTYDNPIGLESTLLSLQRQSTRPSRVYVADDGSGQSTGDVIHKFLEKLPIHHIWHRHNGFRRSTILNKVIAQASEDYLVFIDGDEVLHPRFFEDHISVAAPNTTVLGNRCHLSGFHGTVIAKSPTWLDLLLLFVAGRVKRPFRTEKAPTRNRLRMLKNGIRLKTAHIRPCSSREARGGNMAAWRHDIAHVNGFDETFCGWGYEDVDLVARLDQRGVTPVKISFQAICFHVDHPLLPANPGNRHLASTMRPTICENGILKTAR